jgi:hypothetical protein
MYCKILYRDKKCQVLTGQQSVILILETFHMKKPKNNGMTGSILYIVRFFGDADPLLRAR